MYCIIKAFNGGASLNVLMEKLGPNTTTLAFDQLFLHKKLLGEGGSFKKPCTTRTETDTFGLHLQHMNPFISTLALFCITDLNLDSLIFPLAL